MVSDELLHNFKTNIKFKEICIGLLSRYYTWDIEQIEEFKDIINYEEMMFMKNDKVLWSLDLIEVLKDKMDWGSLWKTKEIELNLDFFKSYEKDIDFSFIHHHKNIDWSNQLLDTYKDKWDWKGLSGKPIVARLRNIKRYGNFYDWERFSGNTHIDIDENLINDYIESWNWKKLCANPSFRIDHESINKFRDFLDWSSLSRNPSMVIFILANPNQYDWNWRAFVQNRGIVFGENIIQFLIKKFKPNHPYLNRLSEEAQMNYAKRMLIAWTSNNLHFDRDIWFSNTFKNHIPWKELIQRKPEILTTEEIEAHLKLEYFEKILPYRITEKLSKEYIEDNTKTLLNFRFSLFRYGKIDQAFIELNAMERDWFQLAFNEVFDWNLDFLINNLNKFDSNYGLSQNRKLFDNMFQDATKEDIFSLLRAY